MRRILVLTVLIFLFIMGLIYLVIYSKKPKDILKEKPSLSISAQDLIQKFNSNNSEIDSILNEKIIVLKLKPTKIENNDSTVSVLFDNKSDYIISATLQNKNSQIDTIKTISIKGLYNGYIPSDETFDIPGTIQLSKCIIL
jgi:amino acid permease